MSGASTELSEDNEKLVECGAGDRSTIIVRTEGGADDRKCDDSLEPELHHVVQRMALECSWQYTKAITDAAEEKALLTKAHIRRLKRRLHRQDVDLKDMRDEIIDEAQKTCGTGCSPFDEIQKQYLGAEEVYINALKRCWDEAFSR